MEPKPRLLTLLDIVTVLMLVIATAMVFFYAPMEAVMGNVQRVFYFHVAAGWVGMLGFLVAAVAGVIYLITSGQKWDRVGSGSRGNRYGVCPDQCGHRVDLGAPNLEYLVDLGSTPDNCHNHVVDLCRLPAVAPGA